LRVGAALASQLGQTARALSYLERALEIEAAHPTERTDPADLRTDYDALLSGYGELAGAMTALGEKPPPEFIRRVVLASDHWRTHEEDPTDACLAAAEVLLRLGADEVAWEYLTTPLPDDLSEPVPWLALAEKFSTTGQFLLAEQAYARAFETEPANAPILWDRARSLRRAGRTEEAQRVLQELAAGQWPVQYQWAQREARQQLKRD